MVFLRKATLILSTFILRAACVEESSQIEELRQQVAEEQRSARLANVALEALQSNASKQAIAREQAEAALAKVEDKLARAKEASEHSQKTTRDLEAQLHDANQRVARAEAAKAAVEATERPKQRGNSSHQAVAFNGFTVFSDWLSALPIKYQYMQAAVAGIFGLLSFKDPPMFLVATCVITVAVTAGFCVMVTSRSSFGVDVPEWMNYVIFGETFLVVGAATWIGFYGFQIAFGALVGISIIRITDSATGIAPLNTAEGVLWYVIVAVICAFLVFARQRKALPTLGCFVGGLFVASSCCFFINEFNGKRNQCPWINGVDSLAKNGGASGPCFSGDKTIRAVSLTVWVFVTALGFTRFFFDWPTLKRRQQTKLARLPTSMEAPLISASEDESPQTRSSSQRGRLPPPPKPPKGLKIPKMGRSGGR